MTITLGKDFFLSPSKLDAVCAALMANKPLDQALASYDTSGPMPYEVFMVINHPMSFKISGDQYVYDFANSCFKTDYDEDKYFSVDVAEVEAWRLKIKEDGNATIL